MSNFFVIKPAPKPPRETARIRQGLSVRVDAGLVKAFREACKRHALRPSDLMERILWNALNEPPMSFEAGFREDGQVAKGAELQQK